MSTPELKAAEKSLPLAGIRVVELCQMVMGPSAGLILADLGADVIKIEPPGGERTRRLGGVACGFFNMFARNKRSLTLDTATPEGVSAAKRVIGTADVLIENFRPGLMKRMGLDYETLKASYPKLIYCSLKGFLPGPYEKRTALDEVVQMMGGLAFMTGPPGQPMRAGASVNDIMGGMFAVIGIQAALMERARTGRGQHIQSALYENNVFLMGQAMMHQSVSGKPATPWSVKQSPWAVYDLFETADGSSLFLSIVGDEQWRGFCKLFGREDWLADGSLDDNSGRVAARPRLIPEIAAILKGKRTTEIEADLERIGVSFAPVREPADLFDDRHLDASGGLLDVTITTGVAARTPALPLAFNGRRLPKRFDPPQAGEQSAELLREAGFSTNEIAELTKPPTAAQTAE